MPAGERRHPRRLVGGEVRHLRVDEEQRPRTIGVHGREQRGDDRGFVRRQDRSALGADGAHDREDVVGEDVDVGDVPRGEPFGAAPSSSVGDDETSMARESAQEVRQIRALPVQVHLRAVALQVEEVRRAVSHDLVRERDVAVPGIPRFRTLHPAIVVGAPTCRK